MTTPSIDRILELLSIVAYVDRDGREFGMSYRDILTQLRETHPDAKTSARTLATYARDIRLGLYDKKIERLGVKPLVHRLKSEPVAATATPRVDAETPEADYEPAVEAKPAKRTRKPAVALEPAH